MANYVFHTLKYPGLVKAIRETGIASKRSMPVSGKEMACVLDYSKCDSKEFGIAKKKAIDFGVVDYAKKNENGENGLRRDLTETEIQEIGLYPIGIQDENTIYWYSVWKENSLPAFFISKKFDDITLAYTVRYESEIGGDNNLTVRNGDFT